MCDSGGERRGDARPRQTGGNDSLELGDELMDAVGRQVELERLDRDVAIAIGAVSAKHRAEGAGADLLQYAKRTERIGERRPGCFRVQWKTPQEGENIVALKRRSDNGLRQRNAAAVLDSARHALRE